MKSLNFKLCTMVAILMCFGWNLNLNGQTPTITGVSATGAIVVQSGSTYSITWTAVAGANALSKEVKVSFTNARANDQIWFADTSANTGWQLQYGSLSSNAWKDFCPSGSAMAWTPGSGSGSSGTQSVYIRNSINTTGTYSNLISFGFGTSCSTITSGITIRATVNVVDANSNIYTWSEPVSGNDSSYKIAGNWTPTRTTPSTNDVLVVDLAQSTSRNTTIYMDGVNDDIDQFFIFPYNNVTFKCSTSTNAGDWTIGKATSTGGDDFKLDTLAGMRIAGGTLDLNLVSGNTAILRSKLSVLSGTLNVNGPGVVTHRADIAVNGGTLRYKSSALTTLNLAGRNTKLTGTGGTLYIDSTVNVVIGNGTTSSYTLERVMPIISNLTLRASTTLFSNSPVSNSVSDINNWTPFLQLNATPKSNSAAHGQLLNVPSTASINGGAQFEIFNNKQRAYRAFGIPLLNGTTIPQFTDDIEVTGTVTGSNANDFTTTCSFCTHSMFQWNEGTRAWSPYASESSVTNIPLGTGILTFFRGARGNGLGDTTVVANAQTLDFKGALAIGNVNVTINNTGTSALKGYNLVGNPYPCAIDLRQVFETNKTKISPRFYLYDAIARRYNEWDSTIQGSLKKNGTTRFTNQGNSSRESRILDAGGAVFFLANSNNSSSETITFQESHKVSTLRSLTKHFSSGVQQEAVYPCNEIKGELRYQDATWTESDGFTMEFDMDGINSDGDFYDMNKLYAGYMGLGTLTANNTWLSIDRRNKIAEIGETKSVPLKVAYPKEGPTALELGFNFCSEGNTNCKIQLFDKTNNTATDITNGVVYPFTASNADEKKADRFELLFTGIEKQSSTKSINPNAFSVFPNPSESGVFYILNNSQATTTLCNVYNLNGQLIRKIPLSENDNIETIDLTSLAKGLYLLNIISNQKTQTIKIQIQ